MKVEVKGPMAAGPIKGSNVTASFFTLSFQSLHAGEQHIATHLLQGSDVSAPQRSLLAASDPVLSLVKVDHRAAVW